MLLLMAVYAYMIGVCFDKDELRGSSGIKPEIKRKICFSL